LIIAAVLLPILLIGRGGWIADFASTPALAQVASFRDGIPRLSA
jgi:hypothetical protein